jgi:hypothetical protein
MEPSNRAGEWPLASCIDHALKGKARLVQADERAIESLSIRERIAVALVLDRADLFPRDHTMLDAFDQMGPVWSEAALRVQRAGLHCEETAHG